MNSLAFLSNVNFQTVIAIISYAFHFPLYQLLFYISEIQIHFLRGIAKEQEILSHFIPNLPTVASAYSSWMSIFKIISRKRSHDIGSSWLPRTSKQCNLSSRITPRHPLKHISLSSSSEYFQMRLLLHPCHTCFWRIVKSLSNWLLKSSRGAIFF